jgi:hypothetical protein
MWAVQRVDHLATVTWWAESPVSTVMSASA